MHRVFFYNISGIGNIHHGFVGKNEHILDVFGNTLQIIEAPLRERFFDNQYVAKNFANLWQYTQGILRCGKPLVGIDHELYAIARAIFNGTYSFYVLLVTSEFYFHDLEMWIAQQRLCSFTTHSFGFLYEQRDAVGRPIHYSSVEIVYWHSARLSLNIMKSEIKRSARRVAINFPIEKSMQIRG